jgi:hypothetical protein
MGSLPDPFSSSGAAVGDSEPRRKWATSERRNCARLIRFTPTELRLLIERAEAAGRPVACYVRESSLGPSPRTRRTALSDSIIRPLAKVATLLGQVSTIVEHQQLPHADELKVAIVEVLDLIRQLE